MKNVSQSTTVYWGPIYFDEKLPPLGGLTLAYSINAVTGQALFGCLYKCTDCTTGPLCAIEVGSKQTTLVDEIYTLVATKACSEYTISPGCKSPKKPTDNTAAYKATSYGFAEGRFLSLKWCHTPKKYDKIVEGASCPSNRKVINSIKSTSCISIRSL